MADNVSETDVVNGSFFKDRGFWRGLIFGYIAKWVAFFSLLFITYLVRPFAWPLFFGEAYSPTEGPMVPGTGEWFSTQIIALLAYFAAGYVAAYCSNKSSWSAIIVLALISAALASLNMPSVDSLGILAIWFLLAPVGVVTGAAFLRLRKTKT